MQLAPPGNSPCGQRTLQAWPGRYGAFFSLLFPFCLAREKNGSCADVWSSSQRLVWCLSLLVDREDYLCFQSLVMTLFARRSFSILRSFMSAVSPDVRYFQVISWLFVFMGCFWGGPGSDFLVLLWSCLPTSCVVTMPRRRWGLVPQRWWGIWVVYPYLQIGCVVVTVSTSSCLAGCVAWMLFTISQTPATTPVKMHMQE